MGATTYARGAGGTVGGRDAASAKSGLEGRWSARGAETTCCHTVTASASGGCPWPSMGWSSSSISGMVSRGQQREGGVTIFGLYSYVCRFMWIGYLLVFTSIGVSTRLCTTPSVSILAR